MNTEPQSFLVRLAFTLLKYFLLALLGFAIAYVMSSCVGALNLAVKLLPIIVDWVGKLGITLFCLLATTVIFESLR